MFLYPFFTAQLNPLWIACSQGYEDIAKHLFSEKPDLLSTKFSPSPLWISCCNCQPNIIKFLMEKMTPEHINEIGPDGTTPLMQLFANIKKKKEASSVIEQLIVHYAETNQKFLLRDIMEASITFGNDTIFNQFFKLTVETNDALDLARMAVLSEDIKILETILRYHPQLKPQC